MGNTKAVKASLWVFFKYCLIKVSFYLLRARAGRRVLNTRTSWKTYGMFSHSVPNVADFWERTELMFFCSSSDILNFSNSALTWTWS